MAALPYMKFYVADYLSDTAHLTTEESGAYLLLIFNYWQRGKPLDNSSERLAIVCRLPSDRWSEIKETLKTFFRVDGDIWHHDRIDCDLQEVESKSIKAKISGSMGGINKLQSLSERQANAKRTPIYTDTDTDTDTDKEPPIVPTGDEQAVLQSYHQILPKCQRVEVLNPKRRKRIKFAGKLARQVCKERGWPYDPDGFWQAYFQECSRDPWLRGDVPYAGRPEWKQNLETLLAEDRFATIMDKAIAAIKSG